MLDISIIEAQLPIGDDIKYYSTVEESFIDTLTTPIGTLIGNYQYGTELHKLKHRSFNAEWVLDAKRCFKDACKWDNRLTFKSVDFDISQVDIGKIIFSLELKDGYILGVVNV